MDIEKRIEKLTKELNLHNKRYYVDNSPTISDQEYDRLARELRDLERQNPLFILPDSPTNRVGNELKGDFKTVPHTRKMLSLDNTYNEQELRDFDNSVRKALGPKKFRYAAELKIDGAAVTLWYEKGLLVKALTRGDGEKGEDITNNVKTIQSIPLRLATSKPPKFFEIRGEVYMTKSTFAALNKEREKAGKELFANPRNAAAGSLKQKDPKEVAARKLDFFAHTFGQIEGDMDIERHSDFIKTAKTWGVPAVRFKLCDDIDDVWRLIQALEPKRKELDYETDGVVVKVNRLDLQDVLGCSSKVPRYAIAFKYPAEQKETILEAIDVQVGKTGVLTPVGRLKPVHVAGSTVSNASLCNQDEIDRLDCRIGDVVVVEKSGEIIPKIIRVIKDKRKSGTSPFKIPATCPACDQKVVRKADEVAIRCVNPHCPAQAQARIEYFVARECMDIDDVGESIIEKLISKGMVKDPADLYSLTEDDFRKLDGIKDSAVKLVKNIEDSKGRDLNRVIASLNIPMIGRTLGDVLAVEFGSLENLRNASFDELEKIEKIGEEKGKSIVEWFANKRNSAYVDKLVRAGVNTKSKAKRIKNPLFEGKTFVLTGTLPTYERDAAASLIKERGGKTSGSVSKNTDFVLAGDSAGSKLTKAQSLGIKVIDEKEFNRMLSHD